jgi:hypothetical protein
LTPVGRIKNLAPAVNTDCQVSRYPHAWQGRGIARLDGEKGTSGGRDGLNQQLVDLCGNRCFQHETFSESGEDLSRTFQLNNDPGGSIANTTAKPALLGQPVDERAEAYTLDLAGDHQP